MMLNIVSYIWQLVNREFQVFLDFIRSSGRFSETGRMFFCLKSAEREKRKRGAHTRFVRTEYSKQCLRYSVLYSCE